MKLTFPHMGNIYIAAKILFDCLGVDYVIPPLSNKKALELGAYYSPEEICLPFKIMIGNYIQSIEKGADTIILVGSCGPCRFGEYGELQMNLLKKLGHNLEFIIIDPPNSVGYSEFFLRLSKIAKTSKKSTVQKLVALKLAHKAIRLIDGIEAYIKQNNGFEIVRGAGKRLLDNCKKDVINESNPHLAVKILEDYKKQAMNIKKDYSKEPLKIALIGEIYTVIEPYANLYIEDKLINYGICFSRHMSPTWWVKDALLKGVKLNSIDIRHASKKYLPHYIGGHARECIGEAMLAKKKGFDGAIQIFPLGCMPEIVSKSILQTISKDYNFPIMTLVVDEMTGEAGFITRLEAFIDLLERRQAKCII